MKRTLLLAITVFFLGTGLTLAVEQYDTKQQSRQHLRNLARQFADGGASLQARLNSIIATNEQAAARIAAKPGLLDEPAETGYAHGLVLDPSIVGISATRQLEIVQAYPALGNESLSGLDYSLYPDFLVAINRAKKTQRTAVETTRQLRQTNRRAVIVRTAVFTPQGDFVGLVSSSADMGQLLKETGLHSNDTVNFNLFIDEHLIEPSTGKPVQSAPDASGAIPAFTVTLPDSIWILRAHAQFTANDQPARIHIIRGSGLVLTLLALFFILKRGGIIGKDLNFVSRHKGGVTLRTAMLLATLLPILMLMVAVWGQFIHASQSAAQKRLHRQTTQLNAQVCAKIQSLFDMPRQVAFTIELFRRGVLDPKQPLDMLSTFLTLMRVQPQLTFLSLGNPDGEFFAVSRPPQGEDRSLRINMATLETGRQMRIYWADDANQPSKAFLVGNPSFDARDKPWYKSALAMQTLGWYPVYRYTTEDKRSMYEGLGIGMSAPLYDAKQQFLGVITADVALSQLSDFIKQEAANLGGTIFVTEANGDLLASSGPEAIYRLNHADMERIQAHSSENSIIRTAAMAMRDHTSKSGNRFIHVRGQSYLLDWSILRLSNGPAVTVAIALPQTQQTKAMQKSYRDFAYLIFTFLCLGVLISLFITEWLAQPLRALENWARRLGTGQWQAQLPIRSPLREVDSLTDSLGIMAKQLQNHAVELEQKITQRTAALAAANAQLAAMSMTDGLTNIANRRHFDEVIAAEWARAARANQPLALLMIDIDHFKDYNDHYGHPAGDLVLSKVAATLSQYAQRAGDLVARYGGEEFVIIATQTRLEEAIALANNIRGAIQALAIAHEASEYAVVTISIGLAVRYPHAGESSGMLLSEADRALYLAKASGRNRVEWDIVH